MNQSISYCREGDYLLPNLVLPMSAPVGILGQRRRLSAPAQGPSLYRFATFREAGRPPCRSGPVGHGTVRAAGGADGPGRGDSYFYVSKMP